MPARYLAILALGCIGAVSGNVVRADTHGADATGKGPLQMSTVTKGLEITVPLKDGALTIGDVAVRLLSDNSVSIQRNSFLTIAARVMRPESLEVVRNTLPNRDHVAINDLKAAGLDVSYNASDMELAVHPKVEQRPRGEITGTMPSNNVAPDALAKPAIVSGYVNVRAGLNYDADTRNGSSAVSTPPLALDGAIRWFGIVFEGEGQVQPTGQVARGGVRAIYDLPEDALRLTAGDLATGNGGLEGMPPILGVALERSYQKLQPSRNIRPTGRRSFRIERPSDIRILVNGQEVRRLQLGPGEYDLDSLPLTHGSNDVRLVIKNDYEEQTLDFNILYNHTLLAPGTSEWAVAGGIQTQSGTPGKAYAPDQPAIMAAYRLGIVESVTSEATAVFSSKAAITHFNTLAQTGLGLFLLDTSASRDSAKGAGWQLALDYQVAPRLLGEGRSLSFSLEATSRNYLSYLTSPSSNERAFRVGASYSQELWDKIAASASVHYDVGRDQRKDTFGGGLSLGRPIDEDLSLSVSANYESSRADIETNPTGLTVLGRLTYHPSAASRVALTYDAVNRVTTASISGDHNSGPSKWGIDVETAHDALSDGHDAPDNSVSGTISYTDDRVEINGYRGLRVGRLAQKFGETNTASVGTAIAFADDKVAISRPIHGSFAIIDAHPAIAGTEIRLAPNGSSYRARTDRLGPAVMSDISPYVPLSILYSPEDLPPGYDPGSGAFDVNAPYKTGYGLTVGSDATISVAGTLRTTNGETLQLLAGEMHPKGKAEKKIPIFTNGFGRFSAAGLSPGDWEVTMVDTPPTHYTLSIGQTQNGIVELGDLRPN